MSSTASTAAEPGSHDPSPGTQRVMVGVGWFIAGVPLLYGLVQTIRRASDLFTG